MIKWLMEKIFGGNSIRFQLTMLYFSTFVVLSLAKSLEAVTFATFSGTIAGWLVSETIRKAK